MKQLTLSLILMLSPIIASADPIEIDGIYYNLINKAEQAEVTNNPNKYSGILNIPSKVIHEKVEYNVTSIDEYAFSGCSGLTSIIIPNSINTIGYWAFEGCSGLNSVHISDLTAWCNIKFNYDVSNPLFYAHHLYLDGKEINNLVIPDGITSINDCAFTNCIGLTSLTIPNSVTSIGFTAFFGCTGLNSITLGESVTYIGESAFSSCIGLTSVNIPNSVSSIAKWAFMDCSGLTTITISNGVISIGDEAFKNCNELISLIIPNSVTLIGESAFEGCSSLSSLTFPNSITTISANVFNGCSGLTTVTIPNSVNSIGYGAFKSCSSLTSITIGEEISFINNEAFGNCTSLTDVYCLAEKMPNTNVNAFNGSYIEYTTLHVPEVLLNDYRNAEPWSGFKDIVSIESGEIPAEQKCAIPSIIFEDGKIKFSCETEGVEYVSNISTTDTKDYYDAELSLSYKYKVTVYATKNGYENSDTATAEFTATGKFGDLDGDGKVNVADHVKLSEIIMSEE